jgi:hypothetical protein
MPVTIFLSYSFFHFHFFLIFFYFWYEYILLFLFHQTHLKNGKKETQSKLVVLNVGAVAVLAVAVCMSGVVWAVVACRVVFIIGLRIRRCSWC